MLTVDFTGGSDAWPFVTVVVGYGPPRLTLTHDAPRARAPTRLLVLVYAPFSALGDTGLWWVRARRLGGIPG